MSPTPDNDWRPGDLEAIRIALGIIATRPAVDAINKAMLQLEQGYADAIPTARILLDQIGVLDAQLLHLSPGDHQGWNEQQRKGPLPGSSAAAGVAPATQVDVVHYATDLLQVEERLVSSWPVSTAEALQRQRLNLCNQLLLILPSLQGWSSQGQVALPPFTAALLRG
ncbi:MAG: hypothetical protein FJ076_00045 [Cyanobacteria bacterium K_DeepCast_35m_m1_288]|jgi:hypothetical protein|nr:hypothetical protein [Cyanobacteria bacterium K_DeepCast_35m_m1_288]